MRRLQIAASLLLLFALLALGCGAEAGAGDETIVIRYSQFTPAELTVPAGAPVTIVLQNEDPIEHEWIVGTEAVHERHRNGTEAVHDEIPSEVTIPALFTKRTTLTFDEPGEYAFICHLPGHEAYGMRGTIRVVAPDA